jgi:hypothetical protein
MARGKVKIDNEYFSRLGHSAPVTAKCLAVGEAVADIARASAPVDTGEYRDRITVSVVRRSRRNVVLVTAEDPKSMFVESETGNLARALGAVASSG